ncbi:MAG: Crp/Fnr family transcriptional regulator [Porticoccaceae bacterium]|nr:Crp/Fnr family transcriptional regulator [Porticoccaceae bacterium]
MTAFRYINNFYDALPNDIKDAIDAVSTFRDIDKGSRILTAGEKPTALHQLQNGQAKYCSHDYQGRGKVLIFVSDGDWVGLSELFSNLPAQWDVTAVTAMQLRTVKYSDFDVLLDRYPIIARELLKTFSLRFSLYRLFDFDHSALSLKERVLKMIYMMSFSFDHRAANAKTITIPISQEELSMVVGASRQKLNTALKELDAEGIVEVRYGAIILCDRIALRKDWSYLFDDGSLF